MHIFWVRGNPSLEIAKLSKPLFDEASFPLIEGDGIVTENLIENEFQELFQVTKFALCGRATYALIVVSSETARLSRAAV